MATLAADKPRVFETGHDEYLNELPAVASDILYQGSATGELNNTGTYQPLGTGSTVDKFAGFCTQQCDNSAGAAAARNVKLKQRGRIVLSVTGVTATTDHEKDVWATDDDTFTLTYAAGAVWIGTVARWISGTNCVVNFVAYNLRSSVQYSFTGETVDLATNRVIFLADRPYYINSADQIHSVAAGGTSTLDITKEVTTGAPGSGTALLSAPFNLNATANTVQNGALATTAGLRKLNAGDRISIKFNHAIQSTAGNKIALRLTPL